MPNDVRNTVKVMSEYYTKQKVHLQELLESLISDDVDAFLYGGTDSAWGLIYDKPSNTIMVISYDGVYGIALSSCLKPNRWHGTGYKCLEAGLCWISKEDLKEACQLAMVLLVQGILSHKNTETPGICMMGDLQKHMYRDLDEYFEIRWPNGRAQFTKLGIRVT